MARLVRISVYLSKREVEILQAGKGGEQVDWNMQLPIFMLKPSTD